MATLWPNTPIHNLQCEIWRRVGASDWNLHHPACRARSIIACLGEMIDNHLLEFDFRLIDLFCGDAVILTQIKTAFPGARCRGVDVRAYAEHDAAKELGVRLSYMPVQQIVAEAAERRYDVALLLNTFRGWDRAGLAAEDADLPARVMAWLRLNVEYVIVTATAGQVQELIAAGWWVFDIGQGEDDSRMVCMFWSGIR